MRILIVTQYFWPEEFRINDLASELHVRGYDVTVLTGMPNYPSGSFFKGYHFWGPCKEVSKGIKVIRVPIVSRGKKRPWRLALNYLSFAISASMLGPLYCRGSFDCIFVYEPSPITVGIPAIILKKIKRAPLFFWVQDLWPESLLATGAVRSSRILAFFERLVRWIYQHSDKILVQSRGFVTHALRMGKKEDDILYLPNWAEDLYRPVTLPDDAQERLLVPKGFVVIFAGNIGAAQGFDTILDAATQCKDDSDIHFLILGDGRDRARVESEIKSRGLENTFHLLGRYPVEAMPRFFSLADVLLVTLKKEPIFALTIPGKVQSYLACGKPIIAAIDGEGARVVEEAKAGVVCRAEDPDALVHSILALRAMNIDQRRSLGMNGRAYFEKHFDRNMLCSRLEGWMHECTPMANNVIDKR